MNDKTLNIFEFRDFKAVGSDIVSPWIDRLLDIKDMSQPVFSGETHSNSGIVLPYPVERILVQPHREDANNLIAESGQENLNIESRLPDIHLVPPPHKALKSEQALPVSPIKESEPEKPSSFFTFISGNSFYAMPSLNVNEIIKYKAPISIFSKKSGHTGIILYRERIVPVYDFSILASGEAAASYKYIPKYIIICVYNYKFFGLSVTGIKTVSNVLNKNIIPASTFKFKATNGILSDIFEGEDGKFYSIIDIPGMHSFLTS